MRRWIVIMLAIPLGYACSGSAPAAPAAGAASSGSAQGAKAGSVPAEGPATDGRIERAALLPVLDAGLGRFLQGVQTEPVLEDGHFVGFRLLSLWPDDPRFAHAGLAKGDVIVRVNGQSIEHPDDAQQVWGGLRVASELYIEYLRDGEPRELRFAIVD